MSMVGNVGRAKFTSRGLSLAREVSVVRTASVRRAFMIGMLRRLGGKVLRKELAMRETKMGGSVPSAESTSRGLSFPSSEPARQVMRRGVQRVRERRYQEGWMRTAGNA